MRANAGVRGQAQWEYLAILGLVMIVLAGLVVLGRGEASRRPPVRPLTVLVAPIRPATVPRPRPTRPRVRRPPAPGPIVVAPRWVFR